MRSLIYLFIFVLGLATSLPAQTPRPAKSQSPRPSPSSTATPAPRTTAAPVAIATPPARPQFRPAVLGVGPQSLINRIDAKALVAKGQKAGAVQFGVVVQPDGSSGSAWTYRAMPNCKQLEQEVLQRLSEAKFTPPIYYHQPVQVILYGTVIFDPEATPNLHIFLNTDPASIEKAKDFIGPQPVIGADSHFTGLHPPPEIPVSIEGVVELKIHVDAQGGLQGLNVTGEDPPLLGFRQSAEQDFAGAKFIPAFLDGDPTDTTCVLSVFYQATELNTDE